MEQQINASTREIEVLDLRRCSPVGNAVWV